MNTNAHEPEACVGENMLWLREKGEFQRMAQGLMRVGRVLLERD